MIKPTAFSACVVVIASYPVTMPVFCVVTGLGTIDETGVASGDCGVATGEVSCAAFTFCPTVAVGATVAAVTFCSTVGGGVGVGSSLEQAAAMTSRQNTIMSRVSFLYAII